MVTLPLVLLAVMSVVAGVWFIDPLLFDGYFGKAITVASHHPAMANWPRMARLGGLRAARLHLGAVPAAAGRLRGRLVLLAGEPVVPAAFTGVAPLYRLLDNEYYFVRLNENVIARFTRALGRGLWQGGDRGLIDGLIINGSARLVGAAAATRLLQSGYIYHYAFAMIIGIMVFFTFLRLDGSLMASEMASSTLPWLTLSIFVPIFFGLLVLLVGRTTIRDRPGCCRWSAPSPGCW
ncbi:hypothetical protein CDEN61S_03398 [Castellaniella denitrificans]